MVELRDVDSVCRRNRRDSGKKRDGWLSAHNPAYLLHGNAN